MDRIADTTLRPVGKVIDKLFIIDRENGKEIKKLEPMEFSIARLKIRHEGGELAKFFDYLRSRMRIARSTVLNTILITIIGTIIFDEPKYKFLLLSFGICISLLALITWVKIKSVYEKRVNQANMII